MVEHAYLRCTLCGIVDKKTGLSAGKVYKDKTDTIYAQDFHMRRYHYDNLVSQAIIHTHILPDGARGSKIAFSCDFCPDRTFTGLVFYHQCLHMKMFHIGPIIAEAVKKYTMTISEEEYRIGKSVEESELEDSKRKQLKAALEKGEYELY